MKVIFLLISINVFASDFKWAKGSMNDPSFFKLKETKFSKLPLSGYAKDIPQTSTHWLHKNGGIAFSDHQRKNMFPTLKELKLINFNNLSPAQKYDIARGDYKYSLTRQELVSQKNYKYEWEGHCHGWVVASSLYQVSDHIKITNKDGLVIDFNKQDILAILAYFEGVKQTPWDYWVLEHKLPWHLKKFGFKKNSPEIFKLINSVQSSSIKRNLSKFYKIVKTKKEFEDYLAVEYKKIKLPFYTPYIGVKNFTDKEQDNDPNPGALHLAFANKMGLEKKALVADADSLSPVWNRPIYGFKSEVVSQEKNKLRVLTRLFFIKEIEHPKSTITQHSIKPMKLEYDLYLDKNGFIIGGKWLENSKRIDFLWSPHQSNIKSSDKYFDKDIINKLIQK